MFGDSFWLQKKIECLGIWKGSPWLKRKKEYKILMFQ